jgi:hypothetical protein
VFHLSYNLFKLADNVIDILRKTGAFFGHFHLLCISEQSYYALKIGFPPDTDAPCSILATFWPIGPSDSAGLADTGEMHLRNRGHLLFPFKFAWQRKTACHQTPIPSRPDRAGHNRRVGCL